MNAPGFIKPKTKGISLWPAFLMLGCLLPVHRESFGASDFDTDADTAAGAPSVHPSGIEKNQLGWRPYERFDTYSGELHLSFLDIHLPGSGDLPIELYRTYRWTAGDFKDPGFQFDWTMSISPTGYYYYDLACSIQGNCGDSIFRLGTSEYFNFRYHENNPSKGITRPGGEWSFALTPEIQVSAAPTYFQPLGFWDPLVKFPINQANDANFMYGGICGTISTYGGRAIEFSINLRMPDGTSQRMGRITSGASAVLRSDANWELRCVASGSPRLILLSPAGLKYEMGMESAANRSVDVARWQATKVINQRTGAWFTIAYDTANPRFIKPSNIKASDDRRLDLIYDHGYDSSPRTLPNSSFLTTVAPVASTVGATKLGTRQRGVGAYAVAYDIEPMLLEAKAGSRHWMYTYKSELSSDSPVLPALQHFNAADLFFLPPIQPALEGMSDPAGDAYRFEYFPTWNVDDAGARMNPNRGDRRLKTITERAGGKVEYSFELGPLWTFSYTTLERFRFQERNFCRYMFTRSNVILPDCHTRFLELKSMYDNSALHGLQRQQVRLKQRNTSDGGATAITYQQGSGIGAYDTTTVVNSTLGITDVFRHVGDNYFRGANPTTSAAPPPVTNDGWMLGALVEWSRYDNRQGASTLLATTMYEWDKRQIAPGQFWVRSTSWHVDDAYYGRILKATLERRDGAEVVTRNETFTTYGSPTRVVEIGSDPSKSSGFASRVRDVSYYTRIDNLFLIDFPASETVTESGGIAGGSSTLPQPRTPCQVIPQRCN